MAGMLRRRRYRGDEFECGRISGSPASGRARCAVRGAPAEGPQVSESAYIAPTAVLAGDVTVGPHSRVLFGAVITAEGGPVEIGRNCVVMENAVVRGVPGRKCVSVTAYSLARRLTSPAA